MAGDQLREVVDIPAVESQLKILIGGLKEARELIQTMPVIGRVGGSSADQAATTEKLKRMNEELAATQQKLVNSEERLKVAQEARRASMEKSAAAIQVAQEKVKKAIAETQLAEERLQRAREKGAKDFEAQKLREQKKIDDLNNAYKQLSKTQKEMENIAHNAALTLGKTHNTTVIAQREAREMGAQLKELEYAIGRYNRNVGNYPGGPGGPSKGGGGGSLFGNLFGDGEGGDNFGGARKFFGAMRYAAYVLPGIGIAGIFNLAFEGAQKLLSALVKMGGSMYDVTERAEKMYNSLNKLNEILVQNREIMNATNYSQVLKYLKEEVDFYEALGYNMGRVLEKRIELAKMNQEEATKSLRLNAVEPNANPLRPGSPYANINDSYARQLVIVDRAGEAVRKWNSEIQSLMSNKYFQGEKGDGSLTKKLEVYEKLSNLAKQNFDYEMKILNDYDNAKKEQALQEIRLAEWKAEQSRKLVLETAKHEQEMVQDKNQRILSDERSTLAQRLEALRSNLSSQIKIADEQRKYILSRPDAKNSDGTWTTESLTAIKDSNNAKSKANRDYTLSEMQLLESYRKRRVEAEVGIDNDLLEIMKNFNERRLKESEEAFNEQIELFRSNTEIQVEIENNRYKVLLSQRKELQEQAKRGDETAKKELEKMEADHYKNLAIIINAGELELNKIRENRVKYQGQSRQVELLREYNNIFEEYLEGLKNGSLTLEEFTAKQEELEKQFSVTSITEQINALLELRRVMYENGKAVLDIDKQIEELRKARNQLEVKDVEANEKRKYEIKKNYASLWADLARATADLVTNLVSKSYQDQINSLQDKINADQEATDIQIRNIEAAGLSTQETEDRIVIAKETSQARQRDLVRQQNELRYEQAKFEQMASIAEIAIKTAEAIAKISLQAAFLKTIPVVGPALAAAALSQIPIAIAIGAVQSAAVLAKGIPKFGAGSEGTPEGWAETDEYGAELYIRPNGEMYAGSNKGANYKWLEKDTKIIPNHKIDAWMMDNMLSNEGIDHEPIDDRVLIAVENQTKAVVKAIKENRPVIQNKLKVDLSRDFYRNELRN